MSKKYFKKVHNFDYGYFYQSFFKHLLFWCGREDSNFHSFYRTATSTLRVYQFRHDRTQTRLSKIIRIVKVQTII